VRFKDRVVLITGGGRGIGAATAELFASEGAKVVVSDMDEAPAREVADPIKGLAIACDVTKRDAVEAMIERTVKELGRIDVLVTCAGIIRDNLLHKMTDDDWDTVPDPGPPGGPPRRHRQHHRLPGKRGRVVRVRAGDLRRRRSACLTRSG